MTTRAGHRPVEVDHRGTTPAGYRAGDYFTQIVNRARAPLQTQGFETDFMDRPFVHGVYPGAPRIPLPSGGPPVASVDTAMRGDPTDGGRHGGSMDFAALGAMLRESYALGGRRLAPTVTDEMAVMNWYEAVTWSRGTASGGGLYPLEIYWVCGAGAPVLPGIYSYSPYHHAMHRLLVGDVSGRVRRAVNRPGPSTDQFLLVTARFWKNAFKYHSFAYHAVTMDVGTALGTWQMWSRATGVTLRPALTFDETALNDLLGIDTRSESVFAVVPLPRIPGAATTTPPPPEPVRVATRPVERSRRVVRFAMVEAAHASTVEGATRRPTPSRLAAGAPFHVPPAGGDRIALPPPLPLGTDLRTALRNRRSSFGRFSAHRPISRAEIGALLVAGTAGARLTTDDKHTDGTPGLTRLMLYANHVDGVRPGSYDYDADGHGLDAVTDGDVAGFMQRNFFLKNYNLEQAAAVVVVLGRPRALIDAVGQRGYRFVNAEVGAAAQALYTACAAAGLGCGAALGFDNASYVEYVGRTDGDEWPLLIVMVGPERRRQPDFHFRFR